jgi:hypothetical protein
MKKLPRIGPFRLLVLVALALIILPLLVAMSRPEELLGVDQPVRYDDFAFSVRGATRQKSIGTGRYKREAKGIFVIVRLKVDNQAKRVGYRFHKESQVLIDSEGREYQVSPDAQAALDGEHDPILVWPVDIPAGKSFQADLVYDVPQGPSNLRLRIGQSGLGVLLDNVLTGRKRFQIP